MKTRGVAAFLALPILLAVVACSGSSAAAPLSSATKAKSPSPTPAPTQTPQTLTFKLQAGKRYQGAQGTVTIDIRGFGYTLTVAVSGLVPGSHYRMDIGDGTCTTGSSDVVLTQDVQPTPDGRLIYVTSYPTTQYQIPASPRVLTVRENIRSYADDLVACTRLDY
jgi:hypothetical protein